MNLLTITVVDLDSSDTMSRTFSLSTPEQLKEGIEELENELPYRKYELMCDELIEDYSPEIVAVLDELEVTF